MPTPVAARSKLWVCDRSLDRVTGSNPVGSMDVCLWVLCVVRCRSLWGGRSLVQTSPTECVVCLSVIEETHGGVTSHEGFRSSHEKRTYKIIFEMLHHPQTKYTVLLAHPLQVSVFPSLCTHNEKGIAAIEYAAQYRPLLDNNFKGYYAIICSRGVKHVSELQAVISST
jgi:hypothetical protein